uniref:Uncharacterized protein n=1 Tax=Physcomitrium patens TaxID=3218 RepID=A0A2K1KUQ9_PHYPA|nr:hypothetical protein PHYPA_004470 [Physcomitrium patens]
MNPQNSVKTQNASSSTIENPSVTEHCGLTTLQIERRREEVEAMEVSKNASNE